ncbi:MAG: aminoacetone oxidase family FAD-binding enzyme, partial [Lachnospiraceae bacterium]|nr:aminoacetone oxidase family FAD-binding enzyme [Lachnospiraceae bacterium]
KNIREDADCIIVCTGGLSYPSTGSDGDGYELARSFGHRVGNLYPSLVRLRTCEDFVSSLQGLSLKNVSVSMTAGKKTVFSGVGEMLFTDDGVSGPLILSCSAHYAALRERYENFVIHTDLKCASTAETLDARILKALEEMKTRSVYNALSSYLPRSLLAVVLKLSGVSADKKARDVTREERRKIIENTKDLKLTVRESGPFEEAVVTHGGINVKDIDPHTMESKIVQGLYFCGEVLDTDAMTGGFNLQTAWSTGYLAGVSAAGKEF